MSTRPRVLPVLTLAGVDPVARAAVVAGLLCDVPEAFVLQYDVARPTDESDDGPDNGVELRRLVLTPRGVLDHQDLPVGHGCLTFAVRDDALETLPLLADRNPAMVLLVLPVATEPLPIVRALQAVAWRFRAAAVVTAVDGATVVEDLLGDATLAERGLGQSRLDRRAVGEVLAHQVEAADVVAAAGVTSAQADRLVGHLAVPPFRIDLTPVHELMPWRLASMVRPPQDPRGNLLAADRSTAPDGDGVWTVELRCDRPVHPDRIMQRVEDLGIGWIRARGHFWLASRPEVAAGWDAAGGQLAVGPIGPWFGDLADSA